MVINKRRKYLIDHNFQVDFILKFCLVIIISSLIVCTLIFAFSMNSTTVAIENTRVVVKTTADFILPLVVSAVLIVSFFAAWVVLLLTLFMSHRISGPAYRLRNEVDQMIEGHLKRNFNTREKDQLKGLSGKLTDCANLFRRKHIDIKSKFDSVCHFLDEKNFNVHDADSQTLKALLEGLNAALSFFKVE